MAMRGDKIKCNNCGKIFIDTTGWYATSRKTQHRKGQDSRNKKFKNRCPYCNGTNTENLHGKALNNMTENK
jgi:DNA-directed RNA polymerase subunit RPC12/RpoP